MRRDSITAATVSAVLTCALAVGVSGCAAGTSPTDTPSPSSSEAPGPTPTVSPAPLATGQIPVPGQDPDATVNGFDPLTVFTLCRTRMLSEYPAITNYRLYEKDDVYTASGRATVVVNVPFGTLPDGRPQGIMVCEVTGTPAAPEISYTGPVDG